MIRVDVKPPLSKVKADFKKRAKDIANLEPAYKKAAIYFDQWVQRNFKTEGGNLEGGKWPAFKYGGRINDQGKGSPIQIAVPWGVLDLFVDRSAKLLQKTGRLRLSMLPFASDKDAGIGSKLSYSEIHNEERRMLPNASEVHNRVEEILHDHGMKALRNDK